jgi:hypothetical protein
VKTNSCWDVFSSVESNFFTSGSFGFEGRPLGEVAAYYNVNLNGGQSISKPVQFTATASVSTLFIEGDRLY